MCGISERHGLYCQRLKARKDKPWNSTKSSRLSFPSEALLEGWLIVSWYENAEMEALPLSAEFDESKHPRAKDVKFTSSPGGGGGEPEVSREEIDDDFARRIETMDDLGEMRELERLRKGRSSSRRRDGASRQGGEPEGKSVNLDEINDFTESWVMDSSSLPMAMRWKLSSPGTASLLSGKMTCGFFMMESHLRRITEPILHALIGSTLLS